MALQVFLGDVPLAAGSAIEWAFAAGFAPGGAVVQVDEATHQRLLGMASPTRLSIVQPGCGENGGSAAGNATRIDIAGVFLVSWTRATAFAVEWRLGDVRSQWSGRRIVGEFNVPNALNDADVFDASATGAVFASSSASAGSGQLPGLAGIEPMFPAARYRAHTLNPATGEAWTALELVTHLVAKIGGATFAGQARPIVDSRVIPEHVRLGGTANGAEIRGIDSGGAEMAAVVAGLLADAEAELVVFPDGLARLVPAREAPTNFLPANAAMADGSAGLARVDAAGLRPKRVVVWIERHVEREFVFDAAAENTVEPAAQAAPESVKMAGGSVNAPMGRLVNVIRLPRDARMAAWGGNEREWPAGAFVPMRDALAAWGISETMVRERWFFSALERELAFTADSAGGDDDGGGAEMVERAAAIREHFRRSFAIHPDDLREVAQWRPMRVTRPNPRSGEPGPSVAMASAITLVPLLRPTLDANAEAVAGASLPRAAVQLGLAVAPLPGEPMNGGVVAGEVEVIDSASGVFRVRFLDELSRGIFAVLPGTVTEIPPAVLNAEGLGWATAAIEAAWTLRVRLSVTPVGDARWAAVDMCGDDELGAAAFRPAGRPRVDLVTGRDAVRIDETAGAKAGASTADDAVAGAVNRELIRRVAVAEGRCEMRRHVPRMAGAVTFEGLLPIEPFGGPAAILHRVDANGRVTTTVRMRE